MTAGSLPPVRVLVVDDSILFRYEIVDILSSLPGVDVVASAPNGRLALERIREYRPDLVTLDMEMPEMDGLAVLDALQGDPDAPVVIVVSAHSPAGGRLAVQAMQKGAFDFITKPEEIGREGNWQLMRDALQVRIRALAMRLSVRGILRGGRAPAPAGPVVARDTGGLLDQASRRMARLAGIADPELVLVGVSTGGPKALSVLIPALPASLGVPVLVVQHMPPLFTRELAEHLDRVSGLGVREAADGTVPEPGTVYIAPGGRQMKLVPGAGGAGKLIRITDDPPENECRPSVDYLFRSVAIHFPGRSIAVIMTGMGSDGTLGLRLLKRQGCRTIAQDEASSVVFGMPKAAIAAGVVDAVVPLEQIAGQIVASLSGTSRE